MNQRNISSFVGTLWVMLMLIVGSAQAQISAYNAGSATIQYGPAPCNGTNLQSAITTVSDGGRIEFTGDCTIDAPVIITKNINFISTTTTTLTVTSTLTIGTGTTSIGNANNTFDMVVATGTLTLNAPGTLTLNNVGNTLELTAGTITNNGAINTAVRQREVGIGSIGNVAANTPNASAALYYVAGTLNGTGTYGNIVFRGAYSTTAATTYRIAANAEVVITNGLTLNHALSFLNPSGTTGGLFDLQHLSGTINGAANTLTTHGNFYSQDAFISAHSLDVYGVAVLSNTAGFTALGSSTFRSSLTVEDASIDAAITPAITVWGDVSILDDDFNPTLTMSQATGSTTSALVALSTTALTGLTVDLNKTVNTGSTVTVTTLVNSGTLVVSDTFSFTVNGATTNNTTGTITKNGAGNVSFVGTTQNDGVIRQTGTGTVAFTGLVTQNNAAALIENTSLTGAITLVNLTNTSGTVRNATTSTATVLITGTITNASTGTLINTGTGALSTTLGFTNSGLVSNTGSGTLTVGGNVTNSSGATLTRTSGTFTINGDLANAGNITNSTLLSNAYTSTLTTSAYLANILSAAAVDGILVTGNFSNTSASAYTGNVIVDGGGTITGLNMGNLSVNGTSSLSGPVSAVGVYLLSGDLQMTPVNKLSVSGRGIFMATNTRWTGAEATFTGNSRFGQAAPVLETGALVVSGGQLQLVSNIYVAQAVLNTGTTVRVEFGPNCFTITSSGGITGGGLVLSCGVFTITSNAKSIRQWLLDAGFNPDAVEVSVEIALPGSDFINLTDATAEGAALANQNWKGVSIVNTQRNFILRNGEVRLNNANLTVYGGFSYVADPSNNTSRIVSVFDNVTSLGTAALNKAATEGNLSSKGYLIFDNNIIGGGVPQANFGFAYDGVNNINDFFTIDRLKINRNASNSIYVVDANSGSGIPSTVVLRERFEVLNNTNLYLNDNNIKYLGGAFTSVPTLLGADAAAQLAARIPYRRVTIATDNMQGTGYFDLGNNDLGTNSDYNTITVNAALTSGSYNLRTQFRQTGTAGQRDVLNTRTGATAQYNRLTRITQLGNQGLSYVSAGSLRTGTAALNGLTTVNDDEFFVYGNAHLELERGVDFKGNVYFAQNTPGYGPATARVTLSNAGPTIVRGDFYSNIGGFTGTSSSPLATLRVNGIFLNHDLEWHQEVYFLQSTPFSVTRPARAVVGGALTSQATITMPTSGLYIQRFKMNRPGGARFAAGTGVLQLNDLLLTNGTLTTDGRLSMRDLANLVPELDGDADPNFATSSAGGTGFEALSNLSIVTRDRTATTHGQLSRGNGSFGAYSSFAYSSTVPGAPYTVQQIGSSGRFSGDELPGLGLVNSKGSALNSVLNRLVIDLATGTEFELAHDLIVKNRLETLAGTLDIAASAFLDIDGDMQWVHGHIVLQDIGSGVVRYPNTTGNAGASAGTTAKYDLYYVSNRNVTTDFEFQTGPGVRDLTIIPTGGTKSAPIVHTLSENKELSGSLRVVDGTFNLNSKTLKLEGNVIVDGKHNANDALMSVNNNGNARVAGWFPVRHSAEAALNPYNYGVGTYDDGHGKINDANGILEFVGTGNSYLLGYVQKSTTRNTRLEVPVCSSTSMDSYCVSLPNIVVTKTATVSSTNGTSNGRLVFEIDQIFKDDPDNQPNAYIIRSFKQNSGVTHLRPGATPQGNFPTSLNQSDAIASGVHTNEKSSAVTDYFGTGFVAKRTQYFVVRENMDVLKGSFFSWGATMTVGGNYTQGSVPAVQATFFGGQNGSPVDGGHPYTPGDLCYAGEVMKSVDGADASGLSNSMYGCTNLRFQVLGNFAVLPDYTATATAAATDVLADVHRFYLANGWLGLAGNYSFFGHADETSGVDVENANLGFIGDIEFNRPANAASLQTALMVQSYRAYFQDVTINGRGVALAGSDTDHMWVNEEGILTLRLGNVVTNATGNAPNRKLILLNPGVDCWGPIPGICAPNGVTKTVDLDGLNVGSTITSGTISLSGSNSFIEGRLRRRTSDFSYTTGGFVQWGYIFPMGETFSDEYRTGTAINSATLPYYRNWQPLTIQNVFNQGTNNWIEVESRTTTPAADFAPFSVNGRRTGGGGGSDNYFNITLNTTSKTYWNVIFEGVPAVEPNVRIGIQGLVTNPQAIIDDMRIVAKQSGKPWRMAGEYDLTSDGPDDTYNPNDWVDGIPQFIQEGTGQLSQVTNVAEVTYRLATDGISNPFSGTGEVARVQLIHNSPAGSVDVFVNGVRLLNDFAYQTATPFLPVIAGTPLTIDIKTSDGATTLLTINSTGLTDDKNYILIAQGGANGKTFEVKVVENARLVSSVSQALQMIFSHGVTNGPTVNLERVSTSTPRVMEQILAVNAPYGSVTGYNTYTTPGVTTFQIKSSGSVVGQYLFTGLGEYVGEAITLLATGVVGGTGNNALRMIGFDSDGTLIQSQITTSDATDTAELPSTFALHGNFPNPFNPTTNIRFDLPEQARVRVEVVDVVGRTVLTVAPQTMSAGTNKVISVDASRLSSGAYFYRVIAEGAERTYVQGSKFTLLK